MARGLIAVGGAASLSLHTKTTLTMLSSSLSTARPPLFHFRRNCHSPSRPLHLRFRFRVFCSCSDIANGRPAIDISKYKEVFARRMAMAGLKPHHRLAIGVSGGPDSMALCLLAALWKRENKAANDSSGFVDGILAIVVDHALRAESGDEAKLVRSRVAKMGVRCEIVQCDWSDGRPKLGHLQEAARDKRYELLQKVSLQHQIGVLLIAHHADDQVELFILRLSRGSGVLGLAGMAFTSQLFPKWLNPPEIVSDQGILLVRPLLEFSKDDMYKICQGGNQEWVEDPTNRNPLFARNRIRKFLDSVSSAGFSAELQAVVSVCRRTRQYVDQICSKLIKDAVIIFPQGYAEIDLVTVNQADVQDICLSKFINLVLQFISQRNRPIRGSASKLILDYVRSLPCQTCLTVAGCYLCPAPGSKGKKALICCSFDSSMPSSMEVIQSQPYEGQSYSISEDVEQILESRKTCTNKYIGPGEYNFSHVASSKLVLDEAKRMGILTEATYSTVTSLHEHEGNMFRSKNDVDYDSEGTAKSVNRLPSSIIYPGDVGYFMNRFVLTWNFSKKARCRFSSSNGSEIGEGLEAERNQNCSCCVVGEDNVAKVRLMVDTDWLYLAELSRHQPVEPTNKLLSDTKSEKQTREMYCCLEFVKLSAQKALASLKSIPVGARKGLPVLVNSQGLLLSIPVRNPSPDDVFHPIHIERVSVSSIAPISLHLLNSSQECPLVEVTVPFYSCPYKGHSLTL